MPLPAAAMMMNSRMMRPARFLLGAIACESAAECMPPVNCGSGCGTG